jgi:MerR family mercuric resistance operon transcriptional regulator
MQIGKLATECDCAIETIRYYEKIGLLPKPLRLANGYRSYDDSHRKWLQFILRSRALGFSQCEVRRLTDIAHERKTACAEVHDLLEEHIIDVRQRVSDLQRMEKALTRLKAKCHDDTLHECPVIDELMI